MLSQIISLLKEILAELREIKAALPNATPHHTPIDEELLDSSDAIRMLKICDKTLYRWRKDNFIPSRLIGNKRYYLKADLIKAMKDL